MKRHLMSTVAVLVVLLVVLVAVGQPERSGRGRRVRMSPEQRMEAIKTIEAQLAKLKEAPGIPRPEGGFQNLSEEERTKFFQKMREVRQEQQKIYDTIIAQVAGLQGRGAPEGVEDAKFVIVNTADLKPIQESAVKEKATETVQLLEQLIARASGQRRFGGRRPGSGQRPERPQRQRQQ